MSFAVQDFEIRGTGKRRFDWGTYTSDIHNGYPNADANFISLFLEGLLLSLFSM